MQQNSDASKSQAKRPAPPNTVNWEDISKPENIGELVRSKSIELNLHALQEGAGINPSDIHEALTHAESTDEFKQNGDIFAILRGCANKLGIRLEVTAITNDEKRIVLRHV